MVGGDRINYPGEVATPTACMLVAKLIFNSVVLTKGAKFMTMDISNFYLMTPLNQPEYIKINIRDVSNEIVREYNLKEKHHKMDQFTSLQTVECMDYSTPGSRLLSY